MNPIIQEHLVSAVQTFVSTFLTVAGATLANGEIVWSWSFIGAIALVAVRAATKEVFAKFAPVSLGGRQ